MKKYKNLIFYVGTIGGFSALMYWIVVLGSQIRNGKIVASPHTDQSHWDNFLQTMTHNLQHPLAILLAQIITIIFVARIFGWLFKKIGQPTVIGEILAGIFLGPSLIGMYFPEFSNALFPIQSLGNLQFLSQIGLILFMFVIGMELDLKVLRRKAQEAVVISHASIVFPFTLGMGLAYFLYQSFAPQGVGFLSFGLFIGIAMSITAFPVLARIVQERGLHKTHLGTIVITCAAADDITAWSLLAAVIAVVKAGSFLSALYIIALAGVYVFIMIKVVKPFLKRVGDLHPTSENLSKPIVALFFLTLIISSYATELIGIHALFGAFMAGAIMPDSSRFRAMFIEKVEDVAVVLFMPLFFVFTGLRTEIGLLNDPSLWKTTGLIILVAIIGKFLGSALASRFVGQNWKDSLAIGALMNTRGLMELVVLNIGYDLGVLTPEIFAMMVIMALVTTFMTGPSLSLINRVFESKSNQSYQEISDVSKYKILLSFGNPERGKSLLRLANGLTKKMNDNAAITAMHLTSNNKLHQFNSPEYEAESFAPIIQESVYLNQKFTTLYKETNDIEADIVEVANKGLFNLLLIGVGQSIYEGSLLGRILGFTTKIINPEKLINQVTGKENLFENSPFDERTRNIISQSDISVGVLIDKGFLHINQVFIPINSHDDGAMIQFARKLLKNSESQITLMDMAGIVRANSQMKEQIRALEQFAPNHISLMNAKEIDADFLKNFDLMLVGIESWKKIIESKSNWLSDLPSTLVLNHKA